jgi:hypothetical protein
MRVAVIVIGIVMVSTPSYASKSCMSQAEARQQLGQVHLYWHGSGHCWDARAGRHGFIRHARHGGVRQAHRDDDDDEPDDQAQDQAKDQAKEQTKDQATVQTPKWRNAMSEMLPTDAPVFRSAAAVEMPLQTDAQPEGPNWLDRWVEIIQVFPRTQTSHAAAAGSPSPPEKFEPMVTPVRVLLAFLAIALIIGVIEILFRGTIHEYRR